MNKENNDVLFTESNGLLNSNILYLLRIPAISQSGPILTLSDLNKIFIIYKILL